MQRMKSKRRKQLTKRKAQAAQQVSEIREQKARRRARLWPSFLVRDCPFGHRLSLDIQRPALACARCQEPYQMSEELVKQLRLWAVRVRALPRGERPAWAR